jgi:glyoxylase-like metal-dependent hydrolase (beta-lactamase superfamily II)
MALPDFMTDLGHGIHAIDTGFQRPRFDAAYLMVQQGRAAFIDTGTNFAVPRLLAALTALGLGVEAVDWVIPTHVHLDHAGGVGLLMQSLPQAKLLVHPRGQRHMVDPSALWKGALAVYGEEEMRRSYGELVPVPEARSLASHDRMVVSLSGRPLQLMDTPGHARHHHCVWDAQSRGWFTGDTFGLSYREFDHPVNGPWILPTSTPVQFEPEALKTSIARLLSFEPEAMYLTHYGRLAQPQAMSKKLLTLLDGMVAIAQGTQAGPERHAQLMAGLRTLYLDSLRAHGCELPLAEQEALLAMDIELNAQGLSVWLSKS